jgi:Ca-activated chloride channel family protein
MEAEYVLDYDVIAAARETQLVLMARIKGKSASEDASRPPLNLGVVLDRSGSMAGAKIDYVKDATALLIQHLGSNDYFGLVIYNDNVQVLIPSDPPTYKDRINQIVQEIRAGGSTNLSGGWLQGCQMVSERFEEGQVNRVLLLSDGLANRGVTDRSRLAQMARQKREEGVTTTTLGVGMDFDEDLLAHMASEGGGAFYFIDSPDQAPIIFQEELGDLLNVVGQNLTITLTLKSRAKLVRQLNNYPMETKGKGGRKVAFRLGDLFADEVKMLVVELLIPPIKTLGEVEVARLLFDYDELSGDSVTHRKVEFPIIVNTVAEDDYEAQEPDVEVLKSALMLRAAQTREEAVKHADRREFKQASDVLRSAADAISSSGLDDEQLRTEHDMLREEAVNMELGAERYDSHARKVGTTHAFQSSHTPMDTQVLREAMHHRHKASREAIERGGETPTAIAWHGGSLTLTGDLVRIGRAPDNDIVIQDDDASRYHCQIIREGDDLFLEDLNSTNGTFANNGLVTGRFRLSAGDVMSVSSILFMLR